MTIILSFRKFNRFLCICLNSQKLCEAEIEQEELNFEIHKSLFELNATSVHLALILTQKQLTTIAFQRSIYSYTVYGMKISTLTDSVVNPEELSVECHFCNPYRTSHVYLVHI